MIEGDLGTEYNYSREQLHKDLDKTFPVETKEKKSISKKIDKDKKEKFSIKKFLNKRIESKPILKNNKQATIVIKSTPVSSTFFNKTYEWEKKNILKW